MMKWSIFDPKNQTTLDEVREKFDVSAERLAELKTALTTTKRKLHLDTRPLAQVEQQQAAISRLKNAIRDTQFSSRTEVLNVFNRATLRTQVKDLMQRGLNVAYVDAVSAKAGATKVYKFEMDRAGRIRLFVATPDNPHEVANSGLYSVAVVDSTKSKAAKTFRARTHASRVVTASSRKSRKSRISFEAEIKA